MVFRWKILVESTSTNVNILAMATIPENIFLLSMAWQIQCVLNYVNTSCNFGTFQRYAVFEWVCMYVWMLEKKI